MALPIDMWTEIYKYIPIADQSKFHRIDTTTNKVPIREFCYKPSNIEVINWLFAQAELLKYSNTCKASIFKQYGRNGQIVLDFRSNDSDLKLIFLDLTNGSISKYDTTSYEILKTKNATLEYLAGTTLFLSGNLIEMNWLVLRDILSLRSSYINRNIASDTCYIQLMSIYLIKSGISGNVTIRRWLDYLQSIAKLLNEPARIKLQQDFCEYIKIPVVSYISDISKLHPDEAWVNRGIISDMSNNYLIVWLYWWICQLKSEDLVHNARINYENTNY